MALYFKTSQNQKITVEEKPLSVAGGEGQVHRIIAPSFYKNYCIKIFHSNQRNAEREPKLSYMIKHSPSELIGEKYMICWPTELVYDKNQFVGFVMPLAFEGSISLYDICRPTMKKNLDEKWHKFNFSTSQGVILRLKLCANLAIAIHKIHQMNHYMLVDMKPQNILLTDLGTISIIDLDSIQIADGSKVTYPAHAVTAEYIPPEGHSSQLHPSEDYIPVSWDRFSLAVVFYEVLFGLPPFAATYNGKYKDCDTIAEKIKFGLFPHAAKSKKYLESLPPLHNNFQRLPKPLKDLFLQAFIKGHNLPKARPSAEEWGRSLYQEITKLKQAPISNDVKPDSAAPSENKFQKKLKQILGLHLKHLNEFKDYLNARTKIFFGYFINLLLYPIALIINLIKDIASGILFLIVATLKSSRDLLIATLLFIFVIVLMLPIRVIVDIFTISNVILWEDNLFEMPKYFINSIKNHWSYKEWKDKYF
jgi:serine/threonine protein kinase